MAGNPNNHPNTPYQSTTQRSHFSSNADTSAFNVPSTTNNCPPNLSIMPPVPTPPFPPFQLQRFQLPPPSLNQNNTQFVPSHPPSHLPPTHFPLHPPPTSLPPTSLPPPHNQSSLLHTRLPPPQHPPSCLPPPNHPPPQFTHLQGPPTRLPPPQPQAPPANLHTMYPGYIPNWHQTPQDATPIAVHTSPFEQQHQISTFYDIKNDHKLTYSDQNFASRSNISQHNKLSIEDMNWLKGFEEAIVNRNNRVPLVEKPLKENKIKLGEVTSLASESKTLLKTLEELKAEMEQTASTATPENWLRLVEQVKKNKEKFNFNIVQLQNPQVIKAIHNRRCKRKRFKYNKKKVQEENIKKTCEWKQKEVEIDTWRERIIKKEKEELREKQIKEEADSILSEITFKENEASMMIQLIDSLKLLRKTRINKGDKVGYVTNSISDNRFDSVLGKLQGLVSSQFSDYKLEEATLRVMMEESGSTQSLHLSAIEDKNMATIKIDNLLFGKKSRKVLAEEFDLQGLVEKRQEWDEFVTSEENPLGSSVPLGWVVPPTTPSQQWSNFLA